MNTNDTRHPEADDQVAEALRAIEQGLAAAWVEGDRSFIEQTLADDWTVTDVTGRVLTKAEVLEEVFGSEDRQVVAMEIDDINVRSFGSWAIVTGRTKASGEYQGEVAVITLRFTDVFSNRNGTWQVLVSHATLLSS